MRIAWITPYVPAPENSGGRIRIARLALGFTGSELSLYARRAPDDDEQAIRLAREGGPWNHVHVAAPDPLRLPGAAPDLARSFPHALWRRLRADDLARPFDVVFVEHCYSAYGLPRFRRAVVVLADHNVESAYWWRTLWSRRPPSLGDTLRWAQWRRFERLAWRRADLVTMVSAADAAKARRAAARRCQVIANGIAIERYTLIPPSKRPGARILFVGSMSYEPNVVAAEIAAREVLPLVRQRVPEASLTIAGRDPSDRVQRLASEHVHVTGTVDDLPRLFDEHAAYLNLVSIGAGSSLKVLEPLAAGLPLVATRFAVRGFPLVANRHYLAATDAASAAAEIVRALHDRTQLDAVAHEGRALAASFDWRDLAAQLRGAVEDVHDELVHRQTHPMRAGRP